MISNNLAKLFAERFRWGATLIYVALVVVLVGLTASSILDIAERRADVEAARGIRGQLDGRRPAVNRFGASDDIVPAGSPFLEGPTVTVAGAALLQRVASAVTKVGGNVLSSQVELQGMNSKPGFINVIASCEIDQPALPRLLYDIEAGMPFLFIEQLVVQSPTVSLGSEVGRMRVLIAVSGQWQGGI